MNSDSSDCGDSADIPSMQSQIGHGCGGDDIGDSGNWKKTTEICSDILRILLDIGCQEAARPGFLDELQSFFDRLPARYALDVSVERAEDVLIHKRLLELAKVPEARPAFAIRAVHVFPVGVDAKENSSDPSFLSSSPNQEGPFESTACTLRKSYPPPSFGSSPNLEALAVESRKSATDDEDEDSSLRYGSQKPLHKPMHEVTFSTLDKPKVLSQLSFLLSDVGLNIREAHVFCTIDGYSLGVFVVDGWPTEDTMELKEALENAISTFDKGYWSELSPVASSPPEQPSIEKMECLKILSDGTDDWEIPHNQLKFNQKLASGSCGELYRGTYFGQDVAIKVLKPENLNDDLLKEFSQEVYIMRKIRHKNVVQFIGACTKPPNLCIVTEYMPGGSVHDYLRKQNGVLTLPLLLNVAIDIAKGMDYLHQNCIIHRDLKAANLLLDENEVVKISDFGVARVQAKSGIMTAETGTYRWMAPEVIEHKPYDHKADVFSYGIVLWEFLTGKLPYENLTPLQAAVSVVQKGLRPSIPVTTHVVLAQLLERCWQQDPMERPDFSEIISILKGILKEVQVQVVVQEEKKERHSSGFFSSLRRAVW